MSNPGLVVFRFKAWVFQPLWLKAPGQTQPYFGLLSRSRPNYAQALRFVAKRGDPAARSGGLRKSTTKVAAGNGERCLYTLVPPHRCQSIFPEKQILDFDPKTDQRVQTAMGGGH